MVLRGVQIHRSGPAGCGCFTGRVLLLNIVVSSLSCTALSRVSGRVMQTARRLLTLWEAQIVDAVHHFTLFHLHPAGFARRVFHARLPDAERRSS
jgi:hypothetical protein